MKISFDDALKEYRRLVEELICFKEDNGFNSSSKICSNYEEQIKYFEDILKDKNL